MAKSSVKVAVIGFGTVGAGVVKILQAGAEDIYRRTGVQLDLAHVVDVDLQRDRGVELKAGLLHDDLDRVLADKDVAVAVELVGGTTKAAEIHKRLLASGKDVVTANKALLGERGKEIFETAREHGRCVAFEASCCGGMPIIGALHTGLAANRISALYGIVNGTCNFVLSGMSNEGKDYSTVLHEAQAAGFAEADPTLDVTGVDSAHKIAILSMLAFGKEIDFQAVQVQGINTIDLTDIRHGQELGYIIKLLAIAEQNEHGLSLRVEPALVNKESYLAQVQGPFNMVSVFGDAVGHTCYLGRGAGMMPTASAVVADLIETARGNAGRIFASTAGLGRPAEPAQMCPVDEIRSEYYLRLSSVDRPGVFAQVAKIMGEHKVNISGCLQQGSRSGQFVPVVMMTYRARQKDIYDALSELARLEVVNAQPVCLPVVMLPADE